MNDKDWLKKVLDFPAGITVDLMKLVVSGHSFGGITAILAAKNDPRIMNCLPMDPWFFALKNDEIKLHPH